MRGSTWQRGVKTGCRLGLAALGLGLAATACGGGGSSYNGPISFTPDVPAHVTTPWQSGQTINVTVAPNSTLSLSNLEKVGGFHGEPAIHMEECDDPGGLVSKLPKVPTFHCDGSTIATTSAVNADGSLVIDNFEVFAIPDKVSLGEDAGTLPTCGTAANQCVLYVGPNQLDFTKPHLFSAPFLVTPDANDKPSALGAPRRVATP